MSDHIPINDNSNNHVDPDSDDEEDTKCGTRRSHHNNNYRHRNSPALFLAQRIEQAVYYDTAEIFDEISFFYVQIIDALLTIYNRHMAALTTGASNAIEST